MPVTYNFSDIFVSYSRKDSGFVRRLTDALTARDYESWVDWEDIPHTADWWAEIEAGIDAANTFVFVISPFSVESKICRDEVDYAVQSNKRIVPIMRTELSEEQKAELHPTLRTHNWIVFTADDEASFNEKLEQLLQILKTDLDHIQNHTRYLVRAREWNQQQRDPSYLLRGADADAAIAWLEASGEAEPAVLPLHRLYLQACREQRRRDEAIEQQRVAVAFIERRTWPAFFIGLLTGSIYVFLTFPDPDPNYELIHRMGFSLGGGLVFGVFLAAISLYADEINQIRFQDQPRLRIVSSVLYGLLFSAIGFGVLQAVYFDARLDFITLILAGFGIGSIFLVRTVFGTLGLNGFLIGALMLLVIIPLFSTTPETIWPDGRIAIFYFLDGVQRFWLTLLLAVGISLGITTWEVFRPLIARRLQGAKA